MKNSMLAMIDELVESLGALRLEIEDGLISSLVEKGWKSFVFESPYWGNHPEYGHGDVVRRFFFTPAIDFSRWEDVAFGHGTDYVNDEDVSFLAWLGTLDENSFVEL